jgi:polysaccharide biosynthesis protein PslH
MPRDQMISLSGCPRRSTLRVPKGRVLYLTNQSPFPPHSGGQLREWQFLSRLGSTYDVHLVAVTSHFQRDVGYAAELQRHCRTVTFFRAAPRDCTPGVPERLRQVVCDGVAPYLADFVRRISVDFVHVEGYFLMHHVPIAVRLPIFLAEENIEYQLDRARQHIDGGAGTHWTVTRSLEQQAWRRAALCGAVTPDDVTVMRLALPSTTVHWLPPGCDHFSVDDVGGSGLAGLPASGKRVVYTGNAAWGPSRDATFYLLDQIWPRVTAMTTGAHLVVAGSGQQADKLCLGRVDPSVHLCGVLPSLGPLLRTADVFVCPVRFGGGVKSKILESLHAGCAIVSTPAGLQGLPPPIWDTVRVGRTAAELADGVVTLLHDDQARNKLRARVSIAARSLTTWEEAARRLDAAWSDMLALTGCG